LQLDPAQKFPNTFPAREVHERVFVSVPSLCECRHYRFSIEAPARHFSVAVCLTALDNDVACLAGAWGPCQAAGAQKLKILLLGREEMKMSTTVNVGEILQCGKNIEIRTRGCDPCVALIVIYGNGESAVKKCAHFSVNMSGPLNQKRIDTALNPILEKHFPLPNISAVGFATGGESYDRKMGAKEIFTRLAEYFPGDKIVAQSKKDDSLTSVQLGIRALKNNDWPFTNDPASNSDADLV